jgi:hypothetical protein
LSELQDKFLELSKRVVDHCLRHGLKEVPPEIASQLDEIRQAMSETPTHTRSTMLADGVLGRLKMLQPANHKNGKMGKPMEPRSGRGMVEKD